VIAELGDQLPEELRIPANLLEAVQGEIATGTDNRTQADLIRITASASEPALAAAIANTWAKQYVNQVNAVYGQVPEEVVAAVQTELDNGRSAYQSAQAALEAFTVSSQVGRLDRLIAEKQGIISKLQEGKQTAIAALVDEELNARQTLIAAYI
jgi:capsule polysaccharide export protein KpsE/RkpR